MATLVSTGAVASCSAASSLTVSSASAVAGNTLILAIPWALGSATSAATPTTPAGWTLIYAPVAAKNAGANGCAGMAFYSKIAATGVNSATFNQPGGGTLDLFAKGVITEWSGMGAHDSADSSATLTNNSAASTTGGTVPNTGTLSAGSSTVFTGVAVLASTGLNPANIATSGGSWSAPDISAQDTSSSVGAVVAHKSVATNAALGAVYTWTSDTSMLCFQSAVMVMNDAGGGGPTVHPLMMLGMGA